MSHNEGKDFLDFEVDDPLDSIQESAHVETNTSDQPAGTGVLVYEGKRYAVGLNWLVGDDSGSNVLALKRAKDFGADFYCMRSNVVSQHGFGSLDKGHRINMPALASVVADVFVGEWHGVFVAENGWWYLAVHSDNIAPDGDLFFTNEEEAYNFFVEQSKAHRWPRSYAPIGWNLSDATSEIPLNKVIGEATPPVLKPVTIDAIFSGRTNRNVAAAAGLLLFILLVLGMIGQQFLPSLIPNRLQVPGPNVNVADILQAPPQEPVLIAEQETANLLVASAVSPVDFIQACMNGLSDISIGLPGWTLRSVRCRENFAEATYGRSSGSSDLALPYLQDLSKSITYRQTPEGGIIIQQPITLTTYPKENNPLMDKAAVTRVVNSRFADMGTLDVRENTPVAAQQLLQGIEIIQQRGNDSVLQNGPKIEPLAFKDLPFMSLIVSTRMPPNMLAPYFKVPGLMMDELEGALTTGQWKYTFRIVPKPDQRLLDANIQLRLLQQKQVR